MRRIYGRRRLRAFENADLTFLTLPVEKEADGIKNVDKVNAGKTQESTPQNLPEII